MAGTVPNNFPPDAVLEIGQLLTGTDLNLTATLATTTFFTAPNPGVYEISAAIHIVTTNGAGTLVGTVTLPDGSTVVETTIADTTKQFAIMKDIDASAGTDGFMAAVPMWMDAGDVVRFGAVAAGLTGTVYNVFVMARRLF